MKRIIIEVQEDWDGYLSGNPYPKTYSFEAHANPCDDCLNNPANNPYASGVCNCVLPYMNDIRY